MRRAHRVDDCQAEVVDALRALGAFVLDLSGLGQEGVPDLFVSWRSWTGFLECKSAGGRLTAGQRRFMEDCPLPVRVVRSADEALRVIGVA